MHWTVGRCLEVRVPFARMKEALAWYARWFTADTGVELQVAPASWEVDEAPTTLQLEAADGIEAATALGAAGASVRMITESHLRFRLDVIDPFGTRWQISEVCGDGMDLRRTAVRAFARANRLGLRRRNVPAPVGLAQHHGPAPMREAVTLWGDLRPPPSLGLPHYEEYDGTRTTGEPWYYWSFISPEGHRVCVMFSSQVSHGQIYAEPRDPDLALRLLGWSPEGWQDARPDRGAFRVMRQDDNGNVFHVSTLETRWDAHQAVAKLESGAHKQIYWVDDASIR